MTTFYDITKQGKFFFTFKQCTDLAKLSDHFTTSDIVEKDKYRYRYGHSRFYYEDKIRSTLLEWSEKIKPDSMCTSYTNQDIRILLSEIPNDTLNTCFVPEGYRVSGSRIYNIQTERKKVREKIEAEEKERLKQKQIMEAKPYERRQYVYFKDKRELLICGKTVIADKYNNHIYFTRNCLGSILIIKRLCTWNEIRKQLKERLLKKEYPQDIKWIKQLWDNPEQYY